jgi:hypothetical protein
MFREKNTPGAFENRNLMKIFWAKRGVVTG